jgi:hypothetical protein
MEMVNAQLATVIKVDLVMYVRPVKILANVLVAKEKE